MNDTIAPEMNSELMFGIPTDFPRIVDSVSDSLCSGFKDYCFSSKQLKDIISICHNKKVTFLYQAVRDDIGNLSYYTLVPGKVKCGKEEVENVQCSYSELPKKYKFVPNNSRSDKMIEASYKPNNHKYEINYFDKNGKAVWRKKEIQNFFEKKEN